MRGLTDAEYAILVDACGPVLSVPDMVRRGTAPDDVLRTAERLERRGLLKKLRFENTVIEGRWLVTWAEQYVTTPMGRLMMEAHRS